MTLLCCSENLCWELETKCYYKSQNIVALRNKSINNSAFFFFLLKLNSKAFRKSPLKKFLHIFFFFSKKECSVIFLYYSANNKSNYKIIKWFLQFSFELHNKDRVFYISRVALKRKKNQAIKTSSLIYLDILLVLRYTQTLSFD